MSPESAALSYITDDVPGITRRSCAAGFVYVDARGRRVRNPVDLERIRSLAIPPAWIDVWIAPAPEAHIQATGRDARGRKQYRYHDAFRAARDANKYDHMLTFVAALPRIRAKVEADMRRSGLPREKVLATVVHLLETTLVRVGNGEYAARNDSYGLTTLQDHHATVEGARLRFEFRGKSGRVWRLDLRHPRVARIVRQAQDLPGQHLFQYMDDEGAPKKVTSSDVNAYLREAAGADVTAKDFRTWAGTVLAAMLLASGDEPNSESSAKRAAREAVKQVAERLGNTPTVCRKCYIHPAVIEFHLAGTLRSRLRRALGRVAPIDTLRPEEVAVLRLLGGRASRKLCQSARGA